MTLSSTASFAFENNVLHVDEVAVTDIARAVGTPVYVYSRRHFERQYALLRDALAAVDGRIFYAVKANSNLAVLRCFSELGAGFDIVSAGELQRVVAAGADPGKVVFSGVGKSTEEIDLALKLSISCFNVESVAELERLGERARLLSLAAPVAIRVNPDVDANTHPYISTGLKENKFGVAPEVALSLFHAARDHDWLEPIGIGCHIGSQIVTPDPLIEALDSLLALVDTLNAAGIELHHLDLGGGFAATYDTEAPFDFDAYGQAVRRALDGRQLEFFVEPGRFLVANGGILVTTVEYLKTSEEHGFAVIDAAMNDLLRPALYHAWHGVDNVRSDSGEAEQTWDIVGPVCESADFLAKSRRLRVAAGDLLAVYSAGAYSMVQSSNYNSRGRPPEVLVDGDQFHVVRRRETSADMLRLELPGA